MLFRLITGCSWDVAGRLGKGSETTLRRRRDEWETAGVCQHLVEEAINAGAQKVIGSGLLRRLHRRLTAQGADPALELGQDPNPTDRVRTAWKWSLATDTNGVPIGWVIAGAHPT